MCIPLVKAVRLIFFIGRMGVVIRHPSPSRRVSAPSTSLNSVTMGMEPPHASGWAPFESHFKSIHRCLGIGAIWGRHIGLAAVPRLEVEAHGLGADGLQVPFEQAKYFSGILTGHQATGDLRRSLGWDDGLAFSLISRSQPIDFQGGACPHVARPSNNPFPQTGAYAETPGHRLILEWELLACERSRRERACTSS